MSALSNLVAEFLQSRAGAPAYVAPSPSDKAPAPTSFARPVGTAAALRELAERVRRDGIDTTSSGFMGYIPGGGLPDAAAASFVAALCNRYVGLVGASPSAAAVENDVVSWLCRRFALPETAWGTLTSGGSIATVSAFLAARDASPTGSLPSLVCYMTEEAHYANRRALHVIGLPRDCIRILPTDAGLRMPVEALTAAVSADKRAGRRPWMVVATAGTTNTGVVDPLAAISAVCRTESLWLHVDAAYGGMFAGVPEAPSALRALALANSIVVDPHKGLFLPYGCGAVLVADGDALRRSLADGGSYLADLATSSERSANDYSIELTRPSRGAQIWAVLRAHGEQALSDALEEKLLLTRWLREKLEVDDAFALAPKSDLTVVAFRSKVGDAATDALLSRIAQDGRTLLSSTRIGGMLYIRCCILCFRTHLRDVETLYALLREESSP